MTDYSLTRTQRLQYQNLAELEEDDLYAILGGDPSFRKPRRQADALSLGIVYRKTSAAVRRGKSRVAKFMTEAKKIICQEWSEFKRDHKGAIKAIEEAGIVYGVARKAMGSSIESELVAMTVLILRSAEDSLDKLCKD